MRLSILLVSIVLSIAVLATAGAANCNITDDTYIWNDAVIAANETPCFVADGGEEGVIIVNGSSMSVVCDSGFDLRGNGPAGITIKGSNVNLSGCKVKNYTRDIRVWGDNNIIQEGIFGVIRVEERNSIIRNNTAESIIIAPDSNATLVENNIINGSISISHAYSGYGYHRILNNIIRTTGTAIAIGDAGLGGIPNIIRGNDISGDHSIGTTCLYMGLGVNGQTIENNNFSCRTDMADQPYAGRNNIITGNDFRGETSIAFGSIGGHGACGNQIWNNRFWYKFSITPAPPWPGCQPNIFNVTPRAGTNIIGGSWIAGNWWGEYPGEDLDGDGIGDTNLPFNNDSAPLVLPPTIYEDCNLANLTVDRGETVYVRRCTISGPVNLTSYGKLHINDSSVGDIHTGTSSVLRLYNVTGGSLNADESVYITNSSLGNAVLSGVADVTDSNFGDTTMSGPSRIINSAFGATTISEATNVSGMAASSLTLSGSNSVCEGLEISGALSITGGSNSVEGNFGSIVLNGDNNNITGTTGSFSINGNGNIIRGMSLNNPQVNGGNTIRDSNITGGVGITASGASLINNTISGTDSCLGWIPSGICLRNIGGSDVRIINNTITISSGGTVRALDSGFTTLNNAEIRGNRLVVSGGTGSTCMYLKGSNSEIANNTLDCNLESGAHLVFMKEGTGNRIEQNMITGYEKTNGACLKLYDLRGSNFSSNSITGCWWGVYFDSGVKDNRFWDNYFHNRGDIAGSGAENNTWNITKTPGTNIVGGPYLAGNWWWTYTGEDMDGDGIGDTDVPHNLDSAPVLALPEVWSDCALNDTINVGVARSLLIRNCTINTDKVNISDYGRLFIEDSRLGPDGASWSMTSGLQARVNITGSNLTDCSITLSSKKLTISDAILTNCDVNADGGLVEAKDSRWVSGKLNITGATGADLEGLDIDYDGTGLKILDSFNGAIRDVDVSEANLNGGANWDASGLAVDELWWGTHNSSLTDSTISNIVRLTGNHSSLSGLTARGVKFTGSYNNVTYSGFSGGVDFGWNYGPGNMLAHSSLDDSIVTMTQSPGEEPLYIINNTISFTTGRSADLEGNSFGIVLRGGIHTFMVLDNSEIINNTIISSGSSSWCIFMKGSKNRITGNDLRCTNDLRLGVDLPAKYNNITRNRFGGKTGISLKHAETVGNHIWDNRFESESNVGAGDGALLNASYWNTTKTNASELNMTNIIGGPWIAGNWWNDYSGTDNNGDGIGDTNLPHKGASWQDDWLPLTNARPQEGENPSGGFVPDDDEDEDDDDEDDDIKGCQKGKVPICHATSSETNPYVFLCVSPSAVDGEGKDDHSHHKGDVIPATDVNDDGVIDVKDCPSVEYDDTGHGCRKKCKGGEKEKIPTKKKTAVVQFVITPAKDVQDVKIHIKRLSEKPAETDDLHGAVYQYLKIDKSVTDEEIAEISIQFAVDNEWLATNNYDPDTVKMKRWHGGFWVTLPTTKESSDEQKTYYIAVTQGMSYFAITAELAAPKTAGPTGAFTFGEGTAAAGLVIVVALGLVLLRRGQKRQRRAPWKASLRY